MFRHGIVVSQYHEKSMLYQRCVECMLPDLRETQNITVRCSWLIVNIIIIIIIIIVIIAAVVVSIVRTSVSTIWKDSSRKWRIVYHSRLT